MVTLTPLLKLPVSFLVDVCKSLFCTHRSSFCIAGTYFVGKVQVGFKCSSDLITYLFEIHVPQNTYTYNNNYINIWNCQWICWSPFCRYFIKVSILQVVHVCVCVCVCVYAAPGTEDGSFAMAMGSHVQHAHDRSSSMESLHLPFILSIFELPTECFPPPAGYMCSCSWPPGCGRHRWTQPERHLVYCPTFTRNCSGAHWSGLHHHTGAS